MRKDEFPATRNTDYWYNPKPMNDIPPIPQHEFYKRFKAAEALNWSHIG
jgi:hypothetical protein